MWLNFCSKIQIIEGVPSLSALSPCHHSSLLPLNAATESQKSAGVIDGIKLVRTHQIKICWRHWQLIDIWHGWNDVTFCDCQLGLEYSELGLNQAGRGSSSLFGCAQLIHRCHYFGASPLRLPVWSPFPTVDPIPSANGALEQGDGINENKLHCKVL